jgi:RNA polymerase sigma-70 factor (ECF subfamily)
VTALADRFEALRPGLLRLAYGQLGSLAESEDVVQEAWLRLQRVDPDEIRDLKAWLTTAVSRLALDTLRSARVRREAYIGPWLPEPVVEEPGPAERAGIAEDLSLALMVVLESLSASERVAFVLHDIFGYEFKEVAAVLDATPDAARQQASRARRAVEARRPRFPATREQQREVLEAFGRAAQEGDLERLVELLHPEVVFTADGGGQATASRKPIVGAERVARAMRALAKTGAAEVAIVDVNGMPGVLAVGRGEVTVVSFTLDDGRIVAIDAMRNPDKLRLP